MTKRLAWLLALWFLLVPACIEKPDPPVPDNPDTPENPENPDNPDNPDNPPEPQVPDDKDVTLMQAFAEDFSGRESEYFDFGRRTSGDDFRFYSGFPSMTETGNIILMLRLDPSDASGTGSVITSKDYTFYGTYSIRLRIPDIAAVQSKLGACVDFVLCDDDEVYGQDKIALSLRLADQTGVYTSLSRTYPDPVSISETTVPELSGFNAAAKNYIYGIDWSAEKISWWIKAKESGDKIILSENTENVPTQPLKLQLRYYHSSQHPTADNASATQAPHYPYELEADWIKYTPSD